MGNVKDIDGNSYKTVRIGDQIWMAENLKVTRYRNGDQIPTGYGNSEWYELKTGAFAVYDDNPLNAMEHGNLYNWYAVVDERNISPKGWHVASLDEWNELIDFLEIEPWYREEAISGFYADITGKITAGEPNPPSNRELARRDKYKSPKMRAFNLTDSGCRHWVGEYLNNEEVEHCIYEGMNDGKNCFWASDKVVGDGINMGYCIMLQVFNTGMKFFSCKEGGFSVRCVKD